MGIKEISVISGYNEAYVNKLRKQLLDEKSKNENQKTNERKSAEKV